MTTTTLTKDILYPIAMAIDSQNNTRIACHQALTAFVQRLEADWGSIAIIQKDQPHSVYLKSVCTIEGEDTVQTLPVSLERTLARYRTTGERMSFLDSLPTQITTDDNRNELWLPLGKTSVLVLGAAKPLDSGLITALLPLANKVQRSIDFSGQWNLSKGNEKRFRRIFELSPEAIVLLDGEGIIIDINSRVKDWIGYSRKQLMGKSFLDLPYFPATQKSMVLNNFKRRLNGEGLAPYELTFKTSKGELRTGLVQGTVVGDEGQPAYILMMITDITRRILAEQALREQQDRLDAIVSSVQAGVLLIDAETQMITFSNPAAKQLLGTVNRRVDEQIHCAQDHGTIMEHLKTSPIYNQECTLTDADGNQRQLLRNVTKITLDGKPHLVESFVDISDRKRAEESLRESERLKTDLVSSVSHELRTPLASIQGFCSTILSDPDMDADTRTEFLHIIHQESMRLTELIEDVLSISRIESGRTAYDFHSFDLNALLNKICSEYAPTIEEKDLILKTAISDTVTGIQADESALHRVLINLLDNAIKFTKAGGHITLSAWTQDGLVHIEIQDTGLGIPEPDIRKIFDRFYRVHRPGKEISGTGLGLPIVKEIVDAHKGTLDVESIYGQGTKITINLPVKNTGDNHDI